MAIVVIFAATLLAAIPAEAAGKRYALIVGVKKYRPNQPLPELANPENDANDLAAVLRIAGYDVTLMTQSFARMEGKEVFAPQSDYIRDQIDAIVNNPFLTKDDLVLVVLTGHGVQYPLEAGSTKIGKSYFCPADAEVNKLKYANEISDRNNLLDLSDLYSKIESSKAGAKLLLVDACRNDPNVPVFDKSPQTLILPVPLPPGGMAAIFSCSAHERAIDDPDLKHSVFIHHIIAGLKGEADSGTAKRPADGEITLTELYEFASRETYDFVRQKYKGFKQSPELRGEFRVSLPLLTLSPGVRNRLSPKSLSEGKNAGEVKEVVPGMRFRWCPPTTLPFTMGSPPTEKGRIEGREDQVQVTFSSGFWLGETEVTQRQWKSVMQTTPWKGKPEAKDGPDYVASYICHGDSGGGQDILDDSAVEFCRRLTEQEQKAGRLPADWKYTLPTEAQWEYACRAGTKTAYAFGDDSRRLVTHAWFDNNTRDFHENYAHKVGQKTANPWGFRDMPGNVCEWCSDWYHDKLFGGEDPTGASSGIASGNMRIIRGGSWTKVAVCCRAAYRDKSSPEIRGSITGFRVAAVPNIMESTEP